MIKKRGFAEAKLVNDYLWAKYRDFPQWKRVRLGPLPNVELARFYKVALRWADAIVATDEEIVLIEGKMKPTPSAVGQLEMYADLFRRTPEFGKYKDMRIKLVLLTTRDDEELKKFCSRKSIDYIVFTPAWVADWWRQHV